MPRLVPRDSGDCLGSILAARRKEGLSTEEVERKIGIDRCIGREIGRRRPLIR